MSTSDTFVPPPSWETYRGEQDFFGGAPPLSSAVGYLVVIGFGAFFSVFTTVVVYLNQYFRAGGDITSEHFNTAGRSNKTGLTASKICSEWTWAATLLQSSNVAWQYGVSGPFWYASGATIQVLLFGIIAINLKKVAPSAHTACEIVYARWGKAAHITFLFFCLAANIIVTSMLLLGGAATVQALTGMDVRLAAFLIPWGVILYTASGGLQATFLASYLHTSIIFSVVITMVFLVYIKIYSSDQIYMYLGKTVSYTPEQCEIIFSTADNVTFYEQGKYACGPVSGNYDGSYLTMLSAGGLMFGIINIVGNFGTVFVDNSYWQSAIAARPTAAAKGYMLGGLCWFAIPFSLATSLGLTATALMLPITSSEAGAGLVPPAVATELLGSSGAILVLIMLFMAIVSTGSAESLAVSALISYDIYRQYFNPTASGKQMLFVSRVTVVVFGLVMGCFAILLMEFGLNLGWVYLFMGIIIGSAVVPLWNMMTWDKASGTGAIISAWAGLILALVGWLIGAAVQSGKVTVDTLGTNEVMLSGNLIAIISSGVIHYVYSKFIDPQNFDFKELDARITLVEEDDRGLTDAEKDPVAIRRAERWVKRRGYVLSFVLIILWPLLSVPQRVFTESYFSFWVLLSIGWAFGAAIIITVLPLAESSEEINGVLSGIFNMIICRKPEQAQDPNAVVEPEDTPQKDVDDDSAEKDVEAIDGDSAEKEVEA